MPLDLDAAMRMFSRFSIRDRDYGFRIPFKLRPQQLGMTERCKEHLARKRRLYVIFCKGRRLGISTWASAIQVAHCAARSDSHAAIIAQQRETAQELFDQADGFAKDLRPVNPDIFSSTKVIEYPHPGSMLSNLRHYTAASIHATRGLTFSSVHMTEAAFYPYDGAYTAILNTLSKDPDNICLIETTPNGMEGPGESYYSYWMAAESGENEFLAIFLPWWEDPEYVANPSEAEDAPRDDYEKFLMGHNASDGTYMGFTDYRTGKKVHLDKSRIAWYRQTLYTKCEGSIDRWRSEYPATPTEAFVATGLPAFSHDEIRLAQSYVQPPLHRGEIVVNATTMKPEFQARPEYAENEGWYIWEFPQRKHHYFAGVDTARGSEDPILGNINPGDFACCVIWNAETGEEAARYMGKVSPETLARHISLAGRFYNDAVLNVELNNLGYVVMKELQVRLHYPNQHRWKGRDDKFDLKPGTAIGFETSERYRRMMFNLYRVALYRKECIPRDKELVRQMINAKQAMHFRWEVTLGHDDVLMAAFLGWISKEQHHPERCKYVGKPRNLLMTTEELAAAQIAMQGTGASQGIAGLKWLTDNFVTADGTLLQQANDHLRALYRYEKKVAAPRRLAGI